MIKLFEKLNKIEEKLDKIQRIPTKTHLKTKDACEYLSVSTNTLIKLCAKYGIQPIQLEGANYYSIADLESLFKPYN